MKLTARLALSQIKTNRNRTIMTLLGIVLSSAMLTAVCGYVESAKVMIYRAMGFDSDAALPTVVIALGTILGAIIVAASVIVVSNAFRVSAGERTRQFGILKSVGATKKQIAASVLYEGVFLSIIGIPIGIIIGLLVDLLGTTVLTNLLQSMSNGGTLHVDSDSFLTVPFVVPPLMFIISIAVSFGTVLLSAWLPARKAAKISAIDAIRSTGEIKLKRKSVRTSKLTQVLFGFEGTLAAKSLKRSSRAFRATVTSLTISIIMLIVAGTFGAMMKSSTDMLFPNIDANIETYWDSNMTANITDYLTLDHAAANTITDKFRSYDNAEIFGVGGINGYSCKLPDGTVVNSALLSVDAEHYQQLCDAASVPVGSNILINMRRETVDGIKKEYAPFDFKKLCDKPLSFTLKGHEPIEITIDAELTGQEIPPEVAYRSAYQLTVIVPKCDSTNYYWFTKVNDTTGFVNFSKPVLDEIAPKSRDGRDEVYTNSISIEDVIQQMNDMINTIMFFVYGFVGMLTLIAVTSVISTISTNVRSRAREFAALESIGMTKSGIKKMLNLESILCSARSLIIGTPLGILGAYALYQGMGLYAEIPFAFPWISILECILGVFAVTWITMRYSASRLKNGSVVEVIRGE